MTCADIQEAERQKPKPLNSIFGFILLIGSLMDRPEKPTCFSGGISASGNAPFVVLSMIGI
jgi:hypothetical protein